MNHAFLPICLLLLGSFPAFGETPGTTVVQTDLHLYKVVGDDRGARAICASIIRDDANSLKRHLDNEGRNISYPTHRDQVQKNFLCNEKDLVTFAEEHGAAKAHSLLNRSEERKYRVRIEPVNQS